MGEAAPAQPSVSGFVPMLGVGSMPGGVAGPLATSRGSAVPQLHSAIVERLRARIELCRRHHSTCERRYQRGQAENSDREHESTLQLLNIVQQGPGNRKTKGNRSTVQQPADYGRVNGEQKSHNPVEAEQKVSTRIALQGLRRKIEGQPPAYGTKQNGLSCLGTGSDFKRFRMEPNALRPGSCSLGPGPGPTRPPLPAGSAMGPLAHRREPFSVPHNVSSELFHITLREMKKEPVEVQACGQACMDPAMMVFDFKDEPGAQIDPELQDLFDELTRSVPSLNDLELERMLKQDEDFGLDMGRPSSTGPAHPCSLLDRPIKTEYSPDFGPPSAGSPQLRPASAGPSFSMASSALSTSPITGGQMSHGQASQPPSAPPRGVPSWPELSHAEQLKQMAANQQQPSALLHHHHHHHHQHPQHHHQQDQSGGVGGWSAAQGGHPSAGHFGPERPPNPGAQRIGPQGGSQNKGLANCLFKPNGFNGSGHADVKPLAGKPMLHFSPKGAPSPLSQQMPLMSGTQSKPGQQQQQGPSSSGQNQAQPTLHYQHPSLNLQGPPCLQPGPLSQRPPLNQHGPGNNFKMTPQRQVMASGPCLPSGGRLGDTAGQQQQRAPPAPGSQQKPAVKPQGSQKGLGQPQPPLSLTDTEKNGTQDPFSRHLTRPPPDYKQPRGGGGAQQAGLYSGLTSQPMVSNGSGQGDLHSLSCALPNSQAGKMPPTPGDLRFLSAPDPPQSCPGHPCQPGPQNRMGINGTKPPFSGSAGAGSAFASSAVSKSPNGRPAVGSDALLRSGMGAMTTNANRLETGMNWVAGAKQGGLLPRHDAKRQPGTLPSPGGQTDMGANHFPPRPVGPPNQVAPSPPGLLPGVRGSAPRPNLPQMPSLPGLGNMRQVSHEQRGCSGTFMAPDHSSGTFQNNRPGRLTFDFLQDGDNTVPGINTDSDFIDSLLKSGSGNVDWMKDINLEEILGSHS